MFVLVTGDNFPGILGPAYAAHPAYMIFFVGFIFICIFVISAIPMAIVLETYKRNRRAQVIEMRINRKKALIAAFCCLDDRRLGEIDAGRWEELLRVLVVTNTQLRDASLLFAILDKDGTKTVDLLEWFGLIEALMFTIKRREPPLPLLAAHLEDERFRIEKALTLSRAGDPGQGCVRRLRVLLNRVSMKMARIHWVTHCLCRRPSTDRRKSVWGFVLLTIGGNAVFRL